ncbi:radical SAM protein [Emergencia sp. 1XD21-10]|nr:radical SAM protein [Emergencia sp. 1XD21-10]NCF00249.1 radical SAM protein [Emergencia sp. 1XD21-10]
MHYVTVKGIFSKDNGMNLYRGCSHGCIYCDSRSKCYQMKHDFEDIEVKSNAIELLGRALSRKRKKCMVGMGSMTDPYVPLELELQHTRKALETIYAYGHGVTLITKSDRVLRDIDLLKAIHERSKCVIQMTLTTFDEGLCRKIEPGVCTTARRVEVLMQLKEAGIPTVVWLCPILPFINDTEENLRGILRGCRQSGVYGILNFGMGVTMREGNREYFFQQLDLQFPGMKQRYMEYYGNQYVLESPRSRKLMEIFVSTCKAYGIAYEREKVFQFLQTLDSKEQGEQLSLF